LAETEANLLTVSSLATYYGQSQILFDVSFSIPATGCVAILGRNGAGKTTLLKSVVGELKPARGTIHYHDTDISHLPTEKRVHMGFGYIPQEREVFSQLTVKDNLTLGGLRLPKTERKTAVDEVIALFPRLGERLGQYAGTLSGGERKMLAIARVLLARPDIMFLDEPTEGVWPAIVDEIARTLQTLAKVRAVVLVEQNIDMALGISESAYVMERGELVLHEASSALRDDPRLQQHLAP
jgi:branched-chain amino acid transport system ATP-binding protein